VYPEFDYKDGYTVDTTEVGYTALVIKPANMSKTSEEGVLLISVYSKNVEEKDTEFKI
jgi:hypothetical protein